MNRTLENFFGCLASAACIAGPWLIDTIIEILK